MIARFHQSIGHKEDVILEPLSKMERANMATLDGSFFPYFYLHLLLIHELGVLIPFTPFEADFLATANALSQVMANVWSITMAFEIPYCHLGVLPIIGTFLYFYSVNILSIIGWVTLHSFLSRRLLEPYTELYED